MPEFAILDAQFELKFSIQKPRKLWNLDNWRIEFRFVYKEISLFASPHESAQDANSNTEISNIETRKILILKKLSFVSRKLNFSI